MNRTAFLALLRLEFLLRSRRTSTLLVMALVVLISWLMIADPSQGTALMTFQKQRLRYDSATLAFGSAHLGNLLLGLAGFYLARGRMQEDLRRGVSGVLGATPVGNGPLLLARFLGALLFLLALAGVQMLSTWALHALRGEGPWLPWVYLQHYLLVLGPNLLVAAAFATFCDAWAPLMGRRGDLLYFFVWVMLLSLLPLNEHARGLNASLLFDLSGLATTVNRLTELIGSTNLSIGGGSFDANLPLRDFPAGLWTAEVMLMRLGSALIALLPLLPAWALFHRFSPDRVRARSASAARGRSRIARLAAWLLRPVTRLLGLLLAYLPLGSVGAELLLSLITQPLALLWLLVAWIAPAQAPADTLWAWQAGILAGWALFAAELGARDAQQAGTQALTAALPGGAAQRHWSRAIAAGLLGLLGSATLLLRQPEHALPLTAGLAGASAIALLLGRVSGSARTFIALFLFWLFICVQTPKVGALDWMGFHGSAGPAVMLIALLTAAASLVLGLRLQRRS